MVWQVWLALAAKSCQVLGPVGIRAVVWGVGAGGCSGLRGFRSLIVGGRCLGDVRFLVSSCGWGFFVS